MTPDLSVDPIANPEIPSTAGMTTRVVKGSLWTLLGQVLPMAVALIATPFTIRFLGSEAYGVVILVGLIPMYFSFADFGMGIASTKFGSEAYGEGNRKKEGEIARTAALIAFLTSLVVAVPILVLSPWIVTEFNVPEDLHGAASIGLKIASVSLVLTILGSVLNTPMLARLRMDLNSITTAVPRILLGVFTPIVLYFGGGVVGAVLVGFVVTFLGAVFVIYLSGRLLPELFGLSINRSFVRPLLKMGGGWLVAVIAAVLLVNLEKLALTRMASVKSLAYYSLAFTFANTATLFSTAMLTSLIPAFSQLLTPEKKHEFDSLFARSMRLNLILLLPAVMVLFVAAKPFFTLMGREEFARESTLPFYILLFGLFFNILAYVPHSTIVAKGRTDALAKLYWLELGFYALAVFFLIKFFGIAGAAAAWSLRVILDAFAIIWISKRVAEVPFRLFHHLPGLVAAVAMLIPAALFAAFYDNFSLWLILLAPVCITLYLILVWRTFVEQGEREWIKSRATNLLGFNAS